MKIALDAMGGDHAPGNPIGGLKLALDALPHVEKFYIAGPPDVLEAELDKRHVGQRKRIEIVPATEVVGMSDSGKSVRKKKQSSIIVATDLVKQGECKAIVSAGHTGAAVTASILMLGRIEGVDFPGIATPLPNEHGICYLLDSGANPDAKAHHLLQYGIMGSVYSHYVHGREKPIVGLMSVGEEDSKGNELTKEAFALLRNSGLHFKGNVEGHDLFETHLDVIVCDGFTGNVILKTCEATVKTINKWLRKELQASLVRQVGAMLAQQALRSVKRKGSYDTYGGCPLLGVRGVVIIAHGGSSPVAIMNALRVGCEAVEHKVNPHIEAAIAHHSLVHV